MMNGLSQWHGRRLPMYASVNAPAYQQVFVGVRARK